MGASLAVLGTLRVSAVALSYKIVEWRATADEDGHLYEASPVKRFFARASLFASQEACVCIHGMVVPLLGRAFAVKPQRPQGCAFWRKGLTAKARAER
jgi:hypothetical protein